LNSLHPDLRFFRVERRAAVAVCLLDRPPANSLDEELHADFGLLLGWLEQDSSVRAVVLGTAHESIFMSGARLADFPDEHFGAEATGRRVELAQATFMGVQRLPKPVVAAITGHALGGGCELALACDFRFMTAGKPLIGLPEIRLGIIPGGGGTQRLPRLIGRARAARLLLLGERVGAEEAAAIGLVDEACPERAATLEAALELAARLAEMPSPGVRLIKQCLNDGYDPGLEHGLLVERNAAIEALSQPEAREGLHAFLEKREPRFHE
jgi:enoyl-CoA hydratase/carnithine racemase